MSLSRKFAGLLGSGTLTGMLLIGFFQSMRGADLFNATLAGGFVALSPMHFLGQLAMAVSGALVMGFLGFMLGDILDHPRGKKKRHRTSVATLSVEHTEEGGDVVVATNDNPLAALPEGRPVPDTEFIVDYLKNGPNPT